MDIALCICTHRRPTGLERLLRAVLAMEVEDDISVVVVDNDRRREGMRVCQALRDEFRFPLQATYAPRVGIAFARNAAIGKALTLEPEWLAFLDDDEWPDRLWLRELLRVRKRTGADVVGGPTKPVFPAAATPLQRRNPYYGATKGLPDATRCVLEAAGNFLIRARVLRNLSSPWFDPAYAHSGSEDLAFFQNLDRLGVSMYWAAHAVAFEEVPASRLARSWMRQRVINIANSRVRVLRTARPGLFGELTRCAKTAAIGGAGALATVLAVGSSTARQQADLLRWKFLGRAEAHIGRVVSRHREE